HLPAVRHVVHVHRLLEENLLRHIDSIQSECRLESDDPLVRRSARVRDEGNSVPVVVLDEGGRDGGDAADGSNGHSHECLVDALVGECICSLHVSDDGHIPEGR
ncbi:hypothetical protein PFISCL1PPCAC_7982, partial [Pristionchus fissidentatus]